MENMRVVMVVRARSILVNNNQCANKELKYTRNSFVGGIQIFSRTYSQINYIIQIILIILIFIFKSYNVRK